MVLVALAKKDFVVFSAIRNPQPLFTKISACSKVTVVLSSEGRRRVALYCRYNINNIAPGNAFDLSHCWILAGR
jgi:hypothetical protein